MDGKKPNRPAPSRPAPARNTSPVPNTSPRVQSVPRQSTPYPQQFQEQSQSVQQQYQQQQQYGQQPSYVNQQLYDQQAYQQQAYQQQAYQQQQYAQQQQYQQQYIQQQQQYQQQQYEQQEQPEDNYEAKIAKFNEDLTKITAQKQAVLQKRAQLQGTLDQFEKKLLHVSYFPQNYPQGYEQQLAAQQQQVILAINKLNDSLNQLDATHLKISNAIETLQFQKQQQKELKRQQAQQERLQRAMSQGFQPDAEAEARIVIPDYVYTQIDTEIRKCGIQPEMYGIFDKIQYLLTSTDVQTKDKTLRVVIHLSTDPENQNHLFKSRIIPALANLVAINENKPTVKNVIWLFNSMAVTDENKKAICSSGVLPYVIPLLMDSDDAMVVTILELLIKVLSVDIYKEIFHAINGMACILELLKEGTETQKVLAMELTSVVGFFDEYQAQIFLQSGSVTKIIQLINSPQTQVKQKNVAIRALVSLSSVISTAIVSAGGVEAIASQLVSNDKEYLSEILNTLISMASNSIAKTMLCDGKSFNNIITLLKSPDIDHAILAAQLLSEILYKPEHKENFEKKGGLAISYSMLLLKDPRAAQVALKLLSVVGFPSKQSESDFLKNVILSTIFEYAKMSPPVSGTLYAIQILFKLSNPSLEQLLAKGNLISSLSNILGFSDPTILEYGTTLISRIIVKFPQCIDEVISLGIIHQLIQLICYPEDRIAFQVITAIEAISKISKFVPFFQDNTNDFKPLIINQINSTNDVIKKTAIGVITGLSEYSIFFQTQFGEHGVFQSLAACSVTSPLEIIIDCLRTLSKSIRNHDKLIESGLLNTLLRYVRSKNYKLLASILAVFTNITLNNHNAINYLLPKFDDLVGTFLSLSKTTGQSTLSLTEVLYNCITLFANCSVSETARKYFKRKPDVIEVLKNIRNTSTLGQNFAQSAEATLLSLLYPVEEIDFPQNQTAIQMINSTSPISLDFIASLRAPAAAKKVFELTKNNIQSFGSKFDTIVEDRARKLSDNIEDIRKKLQESEDNIQNLSKMVESFEHQIPSIEENIATLLEGINELQEQKDEMLSSEIEQKQDEYQSQVSLLQKTKQLLIEARQQLDVDTDKYLSESLSMKEEITNLTNQLNNLDSSLNEVQRNTQSHQKRLMIVTQFLANYKNYIYVLREYIANYILPLQAAIRNDPNHSLHPFVQISNDIFKLSMVLLDLFENRVMFYNDMMKFGEVLTKIADSYAVYSKFSKNYDIYLSLISNRNDYTFKVIAECSSFSQCPITTYMMIILQQTLWDSFLVSCLLKATLPSCYDNRFLRNAARKWTDLSENVEKQLDVSMKVNETIGVEARYKEMVSLLSEHGFEFLDIFGELSESESVLPHIIRYFASQGLSMKFLNHQISREVSETVGDSTLFRANNLPAQCLSAFAHNAGKDYLHTAIKPLLFHIYEKYPSLEINEALLGVSADDPLVKRNQDTLMEACSEAFNFIAATIDQCPSNLLSVCYSLNTLVAKRFPQSNLISVGGLFFLRFVCPCFVAPERFKLIEVTQVDKVKRRNGILISKVLQALSNNVPFGKKEPFMIPINQFIDEYRPKMQILQTRLSSYYDPNEVPTGFVNESDLFEIHSAFHSMKEPLSKKIKETGNEDLLDRFNTILRNMGEPKEQTVEDDANNQSQQQSSVKLRHRLTNMWRKSTILAVNDKPQGEPSSITVSKNYHPLAIALLQDGYALAEELWEQGNATNELARTLISLFISYGKGCVCAKQLTQQEVDNSVQEATLFRSNNFAPKYVSEFSQVSGNDYISTVIRPLLAKVISSNESMEVDVDKLNGDTEAAKRGKEFLRSTCEEWFKYIDESVDKVPWEVRAVCHYLKNIVGEKFPESALKSVGGLFFLRFVCPVLVNPERLSFQGIGPVQRRNLVLLSKVLQNLSNHLLFAQKEKFMVPLNDFIESYLPKMHSLQSRLAEVPADKLAELENSAKKGDFDESELRVFHELAHTHSKTIIDNLTKIEEKLQSSPCYNPLTPPLVATFKAVMLQIGVPASILEQQLIQQQQQLQSPQV